MAMPALDNDRHEKFVQEVFSGKTATAAYQAVYGERKSERVACAAAASLLAFVSIAARLKELQAEAPAKHQITVKSMIADFAKDAADAKNDKQHGAVIAARTAMAKLAGLWVDQTANINGNYAIRISRSRSRNGSKSTSANRHYSWSF